MALEISKVYISILSEFFNLSDVAVMITSQGPNTPPPLLPSFSNVLTTGHHLMKILGEMQDTVNEVNAIEIANEDASGLGALMECTRWRFVDVLIMAWLRGKLFWITYNPLI
jgi:exocyst complex component 2